MRISIFSFIVLFALNLFAENAKIKFMIGDVRVKQGKGRLVDPSHLKRSQWTAVTMQTELKERDMLQTGPQSRCEIELPDGSVTKLLANSMLELKSRISVLK